MLPRIPLVGIGCIVLHEGRVLLVRDGGGFWSTPGGHLDFGESPAEAAIRETREETGVLVHDVDFVAITNDVLPERDRHYITIWMRGATHDPTIAIADIDEIEDAGWFDPANLPAPRHAFFENLLHRRTIPVNPPDFGLPLPAGAEVSGSALRCPLCGDSNRCGLLAGSGRCWCADVAIDSAVLEAVPESQRNRSCICESCARQVPTRRSP